MVQIFHALDLPGGNQRTNLKTPPTLHVSHIYIHYSVSSLRLRSLLLESSDLEALMRGERLPRFESPNEGVAGLGPPSVGLSPPSLLRMGDIGL